MPSGCGGPTRVRRQDAYATFGEPQHPKAQNNEVFSSRLGRPEPATVLSLFSNESPGRNCRS